jgi:cyclic pyranopterin monophosphate synthase
MSNARKSNGMIDISDKSITLRTAKAVGSILIGKECLDIIRQNSCPKGNVLETARIAAVNAAKMNFSLIPMCHPILLESINIDFTMKDETESVIVHAIVKSTGKTGVEMEALAAVSVACLTIYDMLKYSNRSMIISEIKLLEKTGGKSGTFVSN